MTDLLYTLRSYTYSMHQRGFAAVLLVLSASFVANGSLIAPQLSWDSLSAPHIEKGYQFLSSETEKVLRQLSPEDKVAAMYQIQEKMYKLGVMDRKKRDAPEIEGDGGPNSHICCNVTQKSVNVKKLEVVRAGVGQVILKSSTSKSGGIGGFLSASSTSYKERVVSVVKYYIDYIYRDIEGFEDGCPQPICCKGYALYPPLGNCLTFLELESILKTVNEYQDAFRLLAEYNIGK